MKVSLSGLIETARHEGFVPGPYLDSVGVWTVWFGHTSAAGDPVPAMMPRGMASDIKAEIIKGIKQFKKDAIKYERRINDAIKVPLKQHEFDALFDFDYNTGGIYKAFLTREINAGNPKAYEHFMGWVKPPEVRQRRFESMELFRTGEYLAFGSGIPVYKVSPSGKLQGYHSSISAIDILEIMDEEESKNAQTTQIIHEIKPHKQTMDDTLEKALNAKPARWWSRWFK